jgi:signal transduction histidine kinase
MNGASDTSAHPGGLSLRDQELLYRLGWFTRVRWAMGGLALLMVLVSWRVLGMRFTREGEPASPAPAVYVILLVFLYNAAFTFLLHVVRARRQPTRRVMLEMTLGQLACDMIAVSALAHFTGGVENFFIALILVPLVIGTELLPRSLAYATAGVAAVLINAVLWGEQQEILPHVSVEWRGAPVALYANPLYVLEVTAALTVTIFAMVFVASSISNRLRAREAELENAYAALRKADETKSFFMRKAGHEMRAPLAAIHSILSAITHTSQGLEPKHRQLIDRTQQRTMAMMTLVDDLRDYSRLRSPDGLLRLARVPLDEVVRDTVELFRQQAADGGVALTCAAAAVAVEGDRQLLQEVATNLVANAVQYTPAGGAIRVSLAKDHHEATLSVADTGIGISEAAAEKLFDEFYRAPEAKAMMAHGTGLGLAITRRIVQMHGGRVTVDSQPGQGATFTVRVPLRQAPPAP